jgi:hypothetical protein
MFQPTTPRPVTENEWIWTVLGLALLFGTAVRVFPGLLTGFPINDGGMFAVAMRDLMANGFALPKATSYNLLDIPFAYPPFGFYAGAFLQRLGMSELQVLLWLPIFLSVIMLPFYYLFAREFLGDRPRAAVAAVFFALTPGEYVWFLMGGGLTRSFGAIFFMGAAAFIYRSFNHGKPRDVIFAAAASALVVLSHPQYAFLTVLSGAILWLFYGRSRQGILFAALIAVGTALLTAPWWGVIATHHGLDIFLSTGQAGVLQSSARRLIGSLFSVQTFIPFAMLFRVLGVGWLVRSKRFDLIVWGAIPFFLDQRSAPIVAGFTYPLLAAYGFMDALPAVIHWLRRRKQAVEEGQSGGFGYNHKLSISLLGIIFYLALECAGHGYAISRAVLPTPAREMTAWAKESTPMDSRYLILTGRIGLMNDPIQEWFPALAERHSATTIQGLEWTLGKRFMERWDELTALQTCLDMECAKTRENQIGAEADYVVFDKASTAPEILELFSKDAAPLFENERYLVYKR